MFFSTRIRKRQKGLTLTELAIVLGAVGLIVGGVWAVIGTVWNSYQNQQTRQQIITVVENVRTYYMNANRINCTGTADILPILDDDDRRLIPTEMRTTPSIEGSDINHALAVKSGGSFRVYCLDNGGKFRIRLSGLNKKNCMDLLMHFPVLMPELGVTGVYKPDTTVIKVNLLDINKPAIGFPMTLTTAEDWCANEDNEVGFDFKLRN